MDTRYEGSISTYYRASPENEIVLVLDETFSFALFFESEQAARAAYPGIIFELEQVDLLGVKLLCMFPPRVDSMAPATRKRILCGAIAWAMAQLPQGEAGITRRDHEKIHQIQKLWGQQ
jgi:hypothetical protein